MTTNHSSHLPCVPYRHSFEICSFVWMIGTSDWSLSLVGPTFKIIHDFIPHFPFLTATPPVTCPKVSQVCDCRWEHIQIHTAPLRSEPLPATRKSSPSQSLPGWLGFFSFVMDAHNIRSLLINIYTHARICTHTATNSVTNTFCRMPMFDPGWVPHQSGQSPSAHCAVLGHSFYLGVHKDPCGNGSFIF